MQDGNPGDPWLKGLTGQLGNSDRIVTGNPAPNTSYWTPQLPGEVAKIPDVPKHGTLTANGRNDPSYDADSSYFWGIAYLIQKINKSHGAAYKCGDCNLDDMLKAAVDYNGGGVDNYYQRLHDAVKLIQSETPPSTQPTTKPK